MSVRAQLSLELLIYLSLAGLSFAFVFPSIATVIGGTSRSIQGFEVSQFVRQIDTQAAMENSTFKLFVPQGLCGCAIRDGVLITSFGAFYFSWPVQSSNTTLCPDGVSGSFSIVHNGGSRSLERNS